MTVREMVLQDLPDLYPGLTRAAIEHVRRLFDDPPLGQGAGLASELVPIAPRIAQRLNTLSGQRFDDYLRIMTGAAALVLQRWSPDEKAPPSAEIAGGVEAIA